MSVNNLTKLGNPKTPLDVLVWVETIGWMMGNYEQGIWRLYFSDNGLKPADPDAFKVTHWRNLPEKPDPLTF